MSLFFDVSNIKIITLPTPDNKGQLTAVLQAFKGANYTGEYYEGYGTLASRTNKLTIEAAEPTPEDEGKLIREVEFKPIVGTTILKTIELARQISAALQDTPVTFVFNVRTVVASSDKTRDVYERWLKDVDEADRIYEIEMAKMNDEKLKSKDTVASGAPVASQAVPTVNGPTRSTGKTKAITAKNSSVAGGPKG